MPARRPSARPGVPVPRSSSVAVLLHLDSSLFPLENSGSRQLTDAFRRTWQEAHPQGSVIYRDLATDPVPHLDAATVAAGTLPPLRRQLIAEFEKADVVLIGAPCTTSPCRPP